MNGDKKRSLSFVNKIWDKRFFLLKIICISFALLCLIRVLGPDRLSNNTLFDEPLENKKYYTVMRWLYNAVVCILPLTFVTRSRLLRNLVVMFCLPVLIAYTFSFNVLAANLTLPSGWRAFEPLDFVFQNLFLKPWFRFSALILEFCFAYIITISILAAHFKEIRRNKIKDYRNLLVVAALAVLFAVPSYAFRNLEISIPILFNAGTPGSILTVVATFLVPLGAFFMFRFADKSARYAVFAFFTLLLVEHYTEWFMMYGINLDSVLQICTFGIYINVIAMVSRRSFFINFGLFSNLVGALFALLVPPQVGLLSNTNVIVTIFHHMFLSVAPLTAVALRVFPRPTAYKAFFDNLILMTIYFVFVAVAGSVINANVYGYNMQGGTPIYVNWYRLFGDDIRKAVPFMAMFDRVSIFINGKAGGYTAYPVYMIMYHVGYSFLEYIVFLITRYVYVVADDYHLLWKKRGELRAKKTGKVRSAPVYKD